MLREQQTVDAPLSTQPKQGEEQSLRGGACRAKLGGTGLRIWDGIWAPVDASSIAGHGLHAPQGVARPWWPDLFSACWLVCSWPQVC